MAIIRVEKTKNYTIMSNYHFREKEMTLKSKGLLSLMLSLPDNWDYSIAGLVAICKENESAIKSSLKELESFGYLKINKIYPDESSSGRIEYEYHVFEKSLKQEDKKQEVENQPLEYLPVENPNQLKTNKVNTKEEYSSKDETQTSKTIKSKPIIETKSKKEKKVKDIVTMRGMINAFTQNEDIREKLLEYFNMRLKKGLQPNQWQIILDDLRAFAGNSASIAVDKINGAIAGGYMQVIAAWEKDKKNNFSKPKFDNTAGRKAEAVINMTEEEKKEFEENLATDESGNLLQF
ncbi:MAG: hypothetical protein PHC62_05095 [Candidatus Izemoplasmatales bacterium]|nr:hypothetical protein [Candidatus Izemoplasmatales bacterium]